MPFHAEMAYKWRSRFLTVQLRKEYTLQKAITPEDGS